MERTVTQKENNARVFSFRTFVAACGFASKSMGVNHPGTHGRWAFAEFCDVYEIQTDFEAKVEEQFNQMISAATLPPA